MAERLYALRVLELRAALEVRGLDKSGVKKALVERLQKNLEDKGVDIDKFCAGITNKKSTKKTSTQLTDPGNSSVSSDVNTTDVEVENKQPQVKQLPENDKGDKSDDKMTEDYESDESVPLVLDEDSCDEENEDIGKRKQNSDEKNATTSGLEVLDEVAAESTASSAPPQQTAKKSQGPPDDGASTSNGQAEDKKRKKGANQRVLWIMNVPKGTTARQLKHLIAPWGDPQGVKLVVSSRFPGSNLYGYAVMASAAEAATVINKLNNTEFRGRILKIETFDNQKKKKFLFEEKSRKVVDDKERREPVSVRRTEVEETTRRSSPEYRHKSQVSDRSSRSRKRSPSDERIRERHQQPNEHRGGYSSILTFDKIKQERERQRLRERERAEREESRRRREEEIRIREMQEISRRQKSEADRLQREREKLRMERDRIEREKTELLKLERDRQKIEREKIEIEKMELLRSRQRLEDERRATKRPLPTPFRTEDPFQERKRPPNSNNDFGVVMNFEGPLSASTPMPQKPFSSTKDFKRNPFTKHEPPFPEKRALEFNPPRPHQSTNVNRSNPAMKYESRGFASMQARQNRPGPSRESQIELNVRPKESKFAERNRSPQFRPMTNNRDRPIETQTKPNREHHFSEQNATNRWQQASQPKFGTNQKFGMNNQKTWTPKTSGWRPDPPTGDRWNANSSRSMNQPFSGNSNAGLVCPPPPGISSFSDRFDFNKSGGNRKY